MVAMLYSVKTVVGRENVVMEAIAAKAKAENLNILSLFHPEEIKGYIFVEGDLDAIEKAIQMIPHVRGLIKRPIELKEVQKFLQPKTVEIDLNVGDMVEVIGGPFKNEKGKVVRYDKVKREVTIELLEAIVPIPITVNVEFVKLLEKKGK
ncbi:MAG: transcription elongation factor Spt5 [Candidatus Aenigmatarchaeota archaeon]